MASKNYEFTGPVKWAFKLFTPDTKYSTPEKGGNYSIGMNLQGDQLSLYNAIGFKAKAARLDDPEKGIKKGDVTFRRYERHPKLGELGPPVVTGAPEGIRIANDSIATVKVEAYDYPTPEGGRAIACRLIAVNFIDVIEYVKPEETEAPF